MVSGLDFTLRREIPESSHPRAGRKWSWLFHGPLEQELGMIWTFMGWQGAIIWLPLIVGFIWYQRRRVSGELEAMNTKS